MICRNKYILCFLNTPEEEVEEWYQTVNLPAKLTGEMEATVVVHMIKKMLLTLLTATTLSFWTIHLSLLTQAASAWQRASISTAWIYYSLGL